MMGGEQGITAASRRQGLRKTILDQETDPTLGATTALGSMGQLGMGGSPPVLDTFKPVYVPPKYPGTQRRG